MSNLYKPISVLFYFNQKTRSARPIKVVLDNEILDIKKIGLHHTLKKGEILYHIFSANTENSFLELALNTKNLQWALTKLTDKYE